MHLQGDPGGAVVVGKAEAIGFAAFDYHRQPLALAEAAQRRAAFEAGRIIQSAEHVFAGIELRRHAADQGGKGSLAGHGGSFVRIGGDVASLGRGDV
ncbi:hypothetical protein D3C84_1120300 [compost metagenome]